MNYKIIGLSTLVAMLGFATITLHLKNNNLEKENAVLQTQTVSGMIASIQSKHKNNEIKINAIDNKQNDLDVQKTVIGSEQEHLERMSTSLKDLQTTYNETLASSSQ